MLRWLLPVNAYIYYDSDILRTKLRNGIVENIKEQIFFVNMKIIIIFAFVSSHADETCVISDKNKMAGGRLG